MSLPTIAASLNDNLGFFQLKEQCWECQQISLGLALAKWMSNNAYSEFLKPFELALSKVNGDDNSIKGAAVEVQQLSEEIAEAINKRTAHLPKVEQRQL